ncbi:hypothetical protein F4811DRAFT_310863 [Daldinia bambusicola]|nr:hypothetical protein F4811DRAFT_310863 [Daldinia bambusicola]
MQRKICRAFSFPTTTHLSFVFLGSLNINLGSLTAFTTITHVLSQGGVVSYLSMLARIRSRACRVCYDTWAGSAKKEESISQTRTLFPNIFWAHGVHGWGSGSGLGLSYPVLPAVFT